MNLTGKITGLQRDFKSGEPVILLRVQENLDGIDELAGRDLDITLKVHRERRSRDANSYFHVLVDKIARKKGDSAARVKNEMLSDFGQLFIYEGHTLECFFPEVLDVSNDPQNHFRMTDETEVIGGQLHRKYLLIRGSHTYDVAEMSRLIDGTVEQAKDLGIETMSPAQLAHLYELWGQQHGQGKNGQDGPE